MLSIPTFGLSQVGDGRTAAGRQVPLPVKVVRVAIPEGANVSLEPIRAERRLLKGLRLGPEKDSSRGRFESDSGPTATPGTGRTGKSSRTGFAGGSVRLGQTGYFRFQRFVEVIYTPLVRPSGQSALDADSLPEAEQDPTDASAPTIDLEFYPEVEADLVVDGVDPAIQDLSLQPPDTTPGLPNDAANDPQFEDSYRAAFVNYEEGKRFRIHQARGEAGVSSLSAPQSPASLSQFANAITPVYRVFVKSNGIYRLTWSYLLDPATGVAPGLSGATPATFKLMNKGVEVPIRVIDGGNGSFDPGDYIEFYGEGLLTEPKLLVNYHYDPNISPGADDILQANDFTDENVYFLFGESGSRARIPNLSASFTGGVAESAFLDTVHNESDAVFVPEGKSDPFYESPSLVTTANVFNPDPNAVNCGYTNTNGVQKLSNFLGPDTDPNRTVCAACNLNLPPADPNSSAFTATVRAHMRGSSGETANPDHMTVLQVGTATPPSRSSTMCWDGEALVTQSLSVPQSALSSGAGVYIGQPGLTNTSSFEAFFLDWIEVDYKRALRLSSGALLAHFPNAARGYEMSGFPTNVVADMVVYDISRSVGATTVPSPRLITSGTVTMLGAGDFSLKYTLPLDTGIVAGAQQRFAAGGSGGFKTPVRVTEVVNPDDLTATTNAADMIVITTPAVVGAPPVTQFSDYLAHRASASALSVRLVMIRDIYDQFSDGLETPEAIRSFLAYAVNNWKGPGGTAPAPAYVMLVGDSSVDYKNLTASSAWVNDIPSFMMYQPGPFLDYYASDTWIAAFRGGDQLPDIHLGRISVRNPAETSAVFQKLLDYDLSPPPGAWRAKGLFLADRGNPNTGESTEFIALQNTVSGTYFGAPFTNQKLYYALPPYNGDDPNSRNPSLWRNDYVTAANNGAALTAYTGHGSFDDWGLDTLFNSSFISLMSATQMPTVLINEDCLVGGFHSRSFDALGENLMKASGKGTVAVFAPSGLSFTTAFQQINNALYGDIFGLTKERKFGTLITDVRLALSFSITDMQAYVLLG
ncbi:MAG TPA: C25 family cysteine peptidase, partial [Patescibacteria group bacterium]|nr:C25 family cysteine peptidase [Patescibacteria group bacterium]